MAPSSALIAVTTNSRPPLSTATIEGVPSSCAPYAERRWKLSFACNDQHIAPWIRDLISREMCETSGAGGSQSISWSVL
jgi:hypothetical protein